MATMLLPFLMNSGGSGFGAPEFGGPTPGGVPSANPQQPAASLNESPAGYVPGGADAAAQADINALQQERQRVLDQTNEIKSRIKSGTGSILDSVPGSR